jgi:malate/lactate dehydrogenase
MKIGIVGSGFVRATAGCALVMQGVGREIVLVDNNADRGGKRTDIRHAIAFTKNAAASSPCKIQNVI